MLKSLKFLLTYSVFKYVFEFFLIDNYNMCPVDNWGKAGGRSRRRGARAVRHGGGGGRRRRRVVSRPPRLAVPAAGARTGAKSSRDSASRKLGTTRNARAVLLKPAGSRIMFQCPTNSTGGFGRSFMLNSLHCRNNRIFSLSVTHCVRKKLCRRFWRILCKIV